RHLAHDVVDLDGGELAAPSLVERLDREAEQLVQRLRTRSASPEHLQPRTLRPNPAQIPGDPIPHPQVVQQVLESVSPTLFGVGDDKTGSTTHPLGRNVRKLADVLLLDRKPDT